MELKILGCSGGISAGNRTTCYGIGDDILLDCGTGVGALTREQMCAIRHVFLTHSHVDHVLALPLLVDTIFDCLDSPLIVHGQPATIEALREHVLNWTLWPDFAELPDVHHPVLVYEKMVVGDRVEVGDLAFAMIPVDHVVPTTAYLIEQGGRSLCFSGDTSTNDTLWEALNRRESLDLLLIECAFPDSHLDLCRLAKHYCPSLLAADLEKLHHRPKVVITHMKPGGEEAIRQECQAQIRGFDLHFARHDEVIHI